ncbi:hypothetical protein J6590_097259, partial [Homalodisca vitripennis]
MSLDKLWMSLKARFSLTAGTLPKVAAFYPRTTYPNLSLSFLMFQITRCDTTGSADIDFLTGQSADRATVIRSDPARWREGGSQSSLGVSTRRCTGPVKKLKTKLSKGDLQLVCISAPVTSTASESCKPKLSILELLLVRISTPPKLSKRELMLVCISAPATSTESNCCNQKLSKLELLLVCISAPVTSTESNCCKPKLSKPELLLVCISAP